MSRGTSPLPARTSSRGTGSAPARTPSRGTGSAPPRTLLLLRHAKSSWDDAGRGDEDRPLAARGERAAAAVGVWLRQQALAPDLALCSPARRARETLEIVLHQLAARPELRVEPRLYPGEPRGITAAAAESGDARCVLVLGHAPGLPEAALAFSRGHDGKERHRMLAHFPTAALAQLELRGPWSELGPGAARLAAFVVPKGLV